MKNEKLALALARIASNPEWRDAFIRHLLGFENEIAARDIDIREEISGPLVDALFDDDQVMRKRLADGTVFEFLYRSKIARDFIMSAPAEPDHAWEPQTSRLLVELARGAQTVVVGGAYFGDQVILVAKEAAKSGGQVFAFEPNADQRAMLLRNIGLNMLENVKVRSEGLWDDCDTRLTLVGYDSFAYPKETTVSEADSFPTTSIDACLQDADISRLDLIMLDIEGAEHRALKGAERFLQRPGSEAPAIVFEVHQHYVDWRDGLENTALLRYLAQFGYQAFAVRDFNSNHDLAGKPIEIIPAADVYLEGPPHGFNMVALKDTQRFANPNFRICRGVSPKLLRHRDPALHHPLDGL